jgi:hypothetical protein
MKQARCFIISNYKDYDFHVETISAYFSNVCVSDKTMLDSANDAHASSEALYRITQQITVTVPCSCNGSKHSRTLWLLLASRNMSDECVGAGVR